MKQGSIGTKYQQLHLDVGQRNVGVYKCDECEMEFDLTKPEETQLHKKYHASVVGGIKFTASWAFHPALTSAEFAHTFCLLYTAQQIE